MDYYFTKHFIGRRYAINNKSGSVLQIGDKVLVHPTKTSKMRKPYTGEIAAQKWDMIVSGSIAKNEGLEVTMIATNGFPYNALMNEYMFNRLEKIN